MYLLIVVFDYTNRLQARNRVKTKIKKMQVFLGHPVTMFLQSLATITAISISESLNYFIPTNAIVIQLK